MESETSMHTRHPNRGARARGAGDALLVWSVALLGAAFSVACEPGPAEVQVEAVTAVEPAPSGAEAGGIEASSPTPSSPTPIVAPAAAPPSTAKGLEGPPTDLVPPAPDEATLFGTVAELLPAGGYTYLRVEPERGEPRWVVTLRRGLEPGARVEVDNIGSRHDFYSRRLDRSFPELVFGVVRVTG